MSFTLSAHIIHTSQAATYVCVFSDFKLKKGKNQISLFKLNTCAENNMDIKCDSDLDL